MENRSTPIRVNGLENRSTKLMFQAPLIFLAENLTATFGCKGNESESKSSPSKSSLDSELTTDLRLATSLSKNELTRQPHDRSSASVIRQFCGSSGILGECKNLTVLIRGLRFIPNGMSENSRESQHSGDPRKARNEAVHPAGMPELLDDLRKTFRRCWHPSRMRSSFRTNPVVSATLRPPATV